MRKQSLGKSEQNGSDRPLRADAQRNHDALLKAAMAVFAKSGVNAPIKEIADNAGVGVGTFYRRFPKRSDLIVAVFRHEVDGCADAARVLGAENQPFEALGQWVQRYVDLIVAKRGLAAALRSGEPAYEALPEYFERRLTPALSGLLEAAAGEIRADISAAELLRAVPLLCAPNHQGDFTQSRRMIALLINGLRYNIRSPDKLAGPTVEGPPEVGCGHSTAPSA